nr:MAG TPA: Myosin-crossreactive antigen linoleic acid, CLA, MCRA [Caudoviricetes sp.]
MYLRKNRHLVVLSSVNYIVSMTMKILAALKPMKVVLVGSGLMHL